MEKISVRFRTLASNLMKQISINTTIFVPNSVVFLFMEIILSALTKVTWDERNKFYATSTQFSVTHLLY